MELRARLVDIVSIVAFNADVKYGGVAAFSTSDAKGPRVVAPRHHFFRPSWQSSLDAPPPLFYHTRKRGDHDTEYLVMEQVDVGLNVEITTLETKVL
jgi:hypothetical protein